MTYWYSNYNMKATVAQIKSERKPMTLEINFCTKTTKSFIFAMDQSFPSSRSYYKVCKGLTGSDVK